MPAGIFLMFDLWPARKSWTMRLAGCLGLLCCCWLGQERTGPTGKAWAEPPAKLVLLTPVKKMEPVDQQAFMQAKLALSQELLKGLVLADYRLINQSADQLRSLSQHAYWTAASQDPVYNHFTIEFQRVTQRIGENARAENLDGAAYASQLLTSVCIACHQHVRDVKAMKLTPAQPGENSQPE